ncbi:MAG: triose-phosphate isomerase [Firmicutes bacterium]|nr:triose-phosphate isomerase [Bacillota bacterium]
MRRQLIAGNWKMHKNSETARGFAKEFIKLYDFTPEVDVCIAAPFTELLALEEMFRDTDLLTAAQNMHFEDQGAFTGEISAPMLAEIGVDYVIIGHSERRAYFAETDEMVNKKVKKAFQWNITPIICCGETLAQRDQGLETHIVRHQVVMALAGLPDELVAKAAIAYEPVWAIGTGRVATPQQAEDMSKVIRDVVRVYHGDAADSVRILYGGSVKPENAKEILDMEDIDGALVGGASLDPVDFLKIIQAAEN